MTSRYACPCGRVGRGSDRGGVAEARGRGSRGGRTAGAARDREGQRRRLGRRRGRAGPIQHAEGDTVRSGEVLATLGLPALRRLRQPPKRRRLPKGRPFLLLKPSIDPRVARGAPHCRRARRRPGAGPGHRHRRARHARRRRTSHDRRGHRWRGFSTSAAASAPAAPVATAAAQADARGETRLRMTRRRQTIATRLLEAQQTAAMLTTFNEVDLSAIMALRADARRVPGAPRRRPRLHVLLHARRRRRLKAFPSLNAEIQGDEIVHKHYYDIGIAVGVEGGLVVPVLRDADRKTSPRSRARSATWQKARPRNSPSTSSTAAPSRSPTAALRLPALHPDPQPPASRHPGHARHPAAPGRPTTRSSSAP